jgi:HEXXH motif-containing protein
MRHHQLSAPVREALTSTSEDEAAVAVLLDVEASRRLLSLWVIRDQAIVAGADPGPARADGSAGGDVRDAWELLEAGQKLDPAAFRAVLLDPQVGLWMARLLRRLSPVDSASVDRAAVGDGELPLWVEIGFLGQIAVAVAIAAGADFQARVPVRAGRVFLPLLGCALVGSHEPWGTADVRSHDGVVRISASGTTLTLPDDREADAPGWEGLRRLRAAADGVTLDLPLDDLGPYSAVSGLSASGRLTADGFADWQRWFSAMWPVLVRDHQADARALSAGLRSLVPLPRGERLRARAASSSDAFGCVLLSQPDEDEAVLPAQLGVALVHEFRHTLLNGLLFLEPLFEECGELFHAPWRDDPRPLGGLVHGAYAFSGVARYWRTRGTEGLAGFEFALWSVAVHEVLTTLRDHPALTPLGHRLVDSLTEQTEPWREERVGAREERLARLAATHHRATWRAHHLRTPPEHAEALAQAWAAGEGTPAGVASTTHEPSPAPVLGPDPHACRLDALALLARLSIIAPAEFESLCAERDPESKVPGVTRGDLALVAGDAAGAVKLYAEELTSPGAGPAAWAGLGLALAESGEQAAGAVLTGCPELAVALARSLPGSPDPVALAHWLAG